MTLVLTAMQVNKIVQVSDTKLTLEGEPYEENAIKAICVSCDDGYFSIAYSGLAIINDKRLDYWLVDEIAAVFSSGQSSTDDVIDGIVERLNAVMPSVEYEGKPVAREFKGLVLVISGFRLSGNGKLTAPFVTTVSNIYGQVGMSGGDVSDDFAVQPYGINPRQPDNYTPVVIQGERRAILAGDAHAEKTERKFKEATRQLRRIDKQPDTSAETSSKLIAEVIQRASKHPTYGKYIGSRCISAVLRPEADEIPCHYHCEDRPSVIRMPHLVTPMLAAFDGEIRTDFDPDEHRPQ